MLWYKSSHKLKIIDFHNAKVYFYAQSFSLQIT